MICAPLPEGRRQRAREKGGRLQRNRRAPQALVLQIFSTVAWRCVLQIRHHRARIPPEGMDTSVWRARYYVGMAY